MGNNAAAPAVQLQSIRIALAVIAYRRWNFRAVGVSRAFLRSKPLVRNTYVKLPDGAGQEIQGRSTEEVLFNALAWSVPFTEMGYWVRGLPAPGKHDGIGLDYGGRARHLTQRGWQIEYPEYRMFQGVELPNRIVIRALPGTVTLDRGDPTSVDPILVKIIIGSWSGQPKAG